MISFDLLPVAADEIVEACNFLNERWPGKGDELRNAVEFEIEQICRSPRIGKSHKRNTRKKVVAAFPYYTIVYIPESMRILVVAFAHSSRKPEYWFDRV